MTSRLATTDKIDELCRDFRKLGCHVNRDHDAGTVRVTMLGQVVFLAIQKGAGNIWLASYLKNDHIQFLWGDNGPNPTEAAGGEHGGVPESDRPAAADDRTQP